MSLNLFIGLVLVGMAFILLRYLLSDNKKQNEKPPTLNLEKASAPASQPVPRAPLARAPSAAPARASAPAKPQAAAPARAQSSARRADDTSSSSAPVYDDSFLLVNTTRFSSVDNDSSPSRHDSTPSYGSSSHHSDSLPSHTAPPTDTSPVSSCSSGSSGCGD